MEAGRVFERTSENFFVYTVCLTELYTFSIFNNSSIRPDIDPKFFSLEGCEHREWGFAVQLALLTQIKFFFAHGTFFSGFVQNPPIFPIPYANFSKSIFSIPYANFSKSTFSIPYANFSRSSSFPLFNCNLTKMWQLPSNPSLTAHPKPCQNSLNFLEHCREACGKASWNFHFTATIFLSMG